MLLLHTADVRGAEPEDLINRLLTYEPMRHQIPEFAAGSGQYLHVACCTTVSANTVALVINDW